MGFGSAKPPNVGKRPAHSRMKAARVAKAAAKKGSSSMGALLKPLGRDKKKQRIVEKRIAHAKRAIEAKKTALPAGVKASDVNRMVEEQ